jgi:hypothetical protein
MLWMLGFLELSLLSPWGHNVWPFRWAHLVWHDSLARSWFGGAREERALPQRKHDSWTCQEWLSWLDPLVLIQWFGVDCLTDFVYVVKFRIRRSHEKPKGNCSETRDTTRLILSSVSHSYPTLIPARRRRSDLLLPIRVALRCNGWGPQELDFCIAVAVCPHLDFSIGTEW